MKMDPSKRSNGWERREGTYANMRRWSKVLFLWEVNPLVRHMGQFMVDIGWMWRMQQWWWIIGEKVPIEILQWYVYTHSHHSSMQQRVRLESRHEHSSLCKNGNIQTNYNFVRLLHIPLTIMVYDSTSIWVFGNYLASLEKIVPHHWENNIVKLPKWYLHVYITDAWRLPKIHMLVTRVRSITSFFSLILNFIKCHIRAYEWLLRRIHPKASC